MWAQRLAATVSAGSLVAFPLCILTYWLLYPAYGLLAPEAILRAIERNPSATELANGFGLMGTFLAVPATLGIMGVLRGRAPRSAIVGGGIPLVNAIETSGRSMSNRHLAAQLDEVRQRVQEGQGFAAALRERATFPDVAVKMVEVGESTGALQEMLNSLADFYDEEIETEVSRFITLVEPVLLVIMGIIIAVVVLALYMPLFELTSVVQAG